jgi:hypothetical protein
MVVSMALVRHSPSFDFLFHFPVDRSRFLSPVAFSSVRYHRFHSCRWLSLRSSPSCSRRLNSFSSRCSITNTDVCHEFVTTDDEIHEDLLTPIEDHSIPIVHLDTNISVTESLTLLTECTYVDTVLTALPVRSFFPFLVKHSTFSTFFVKQINLVLGFRYCLRKSRL